MTDSMELSSARHWRRSTKTLSTPHNLEVDTSQVEDFFTRLHRMCQGTETYGVTLKREEILEISRLANYLFFHTLCYAGIGGEHKHYWAFVDKVLRQPEPSCIISFNYDLLLDSWLTRLCQRLDIRRGVFVPLDELRWTYGISFKGIYHQQFYELPPDVKISYYKLHGSLNMSFNPDNKEVSLHTLVADHHAYRRFHRGDWPSQPFLIPPLLQKEISIPVLRQVWEQAGQKLLQSREIHVIGYSAPDADQSAIELLKSVKRDGIAKVVIVNPTRAHRRRIQGFLGVPDTVVESYDTFEEYLQRGHGADLTPGKARQAAEAV